MTRRWPDAARSALVAAAATGVWACQAYDRGAYARLLVESAHDADTVVCEGGLPTCGTRCVDLQSDPLDCGRCGQACGATEVCRAGACVAAQSLDGGGDDVPRPDASGLDGTDGSDATVPDAAAATPPMFRGVQTASVASGLGCCLTIDRPTEAAAGQLLLASIAMGINGSPTLPMMATPPGWTLVRRTDYARTLSLWTFWHVVAATDPMNYTFTTDQTSLGGVGWIAAYSGVDTSSPIDAEHSTTVTGPVPTFMAPVITTTVPQTLLVVNIAGFSTGPTMWSTTSDLLKIVDVNNGTSRSGTSVQIALPVVGLSGMRTATASLPQSYGIVDVLALTPAVH